MHLRDERAGRVDDLQLALLRLDPNARRNAMGAENQNGADRNLADRFNENCAASPQLIDNITVVDNLMVNIYRLSISLEGQFHDVDRPDHTRAEASRPHP